MAEEIIGFNREDADGLLEILDNQDGQPKKRGKQPRGYIPIPRTDQYVRVTSTSTNTDIGVASYPGVRLDHNARANTWSDKDVIYVLFANGVTPTSTSTRYHAKVTGVHPTNGRLIYAAYDAPSTASMPAFSGCHVTRSSAQSITSATIILTSITFDTELYDTDSYHDLGSNTDRLVAPFTGYYSWGGNGWFAQNATGVRVVLMTPSVTFSGLVTNGTGETQAAYSGKNWDQAFCCYGEAHLTAGDYVTLSVLQDSGGNLNFTNAQAWMRFLGN